MGNPILDAMQGLGLWSDPAANGDPRRPPASESVPRRGPVSDTLVMGPTGQPERKVSEQPVADPRAADSERDLAAWLRSLPNRRDPAAATARSVGVQAGVVPAAVGVQAGPSAGSTGGSPRDSQLDAEIQGLLRSARVPVAESEVQPKMHSGVNYTLDSIDAAREGMRRDVMSNRAQQYKMAMDLMAAREARGQAMAGDMRKYDIDADRNMIERERMRADVAAREEALKSAADLRRESVLQTLSSTNPVAGAELARKYKIATPEQHITQQAPGFFQKDDKGQPALPASFDDAILKYREGGGKPITPGTPAHDALLQKYGDVMKARIEGKPAHWNEYPLPIPGLGGNFQHGVNVGDALQFGLPAAVRAYLGTMNKGQYASQAAQQLLRNPQIGVKLPDVTGRVGVPTGP